MTNSNVGEQKIRPSLMGRVFKRRRQDALTPLQMLQGLSELNLVAVLQENCIWVAVDAATAQLLDRCCTGQQDGGPATAVEIMSIVSLWRSEQSQGQRAEQGPDKQAEVPVQMQRQPSALNQDQGQGQLTPQQSPLQTPQRPANAEQEQAAAAGSTKALMPIAIRLSLEESFFLKYTLNSLTVITAQPLAGSDAQELTEQALWDACRSIRPNFPVSYAGYHHMKCKGWLPRSGLLYGVDYVLYQMHPTAVHSEFGVMLVPLSGPYRPQLGWLDVQITNRLINQVSKRLLLLYLHESPDSPGHGTPACLDHFTAEERLLKRWVPSSIR